MYLLSGSHRWMPILESVIDVAKTPPMHCMPASVIGSKHPIRCTCTK